MMKHSVLLTFFMALTGLSAHAAGYDDNAMKVKEMKLSNGLTVWINEDHSQPKVFGAVVVKAGAADCPNTGIAHYFEHMMFKGTDKIGTVDYEKERPWLDSISAKYDLLAHTADEATRRQIQADINRLGTKAANMPYLTSSATLCRATAVRDLTPQRALIIQYISTRFCRSI